MKWFGIAIVVLFIAVAAPTCLAQDKSNNAALAEENILIVQLNVGEEATTENIDLYQHEGGYLVPLGFLTQFIDFAITVRPETGQADGWFLKENQNFILDANKRIVVIAGKEKALDSRLVVVGSDDIYVDSSLFAEWFPVDLDLNFSMLILKLKPRQKLPFQDKQERGNKRKYISRSEKIANNYPKINTNPANFSIPMMDIDFGNQFDSKATPQNNASYSIMAQGDAAKLSTNLIMAGNSEDSLTSLRLKAGNKDKEGKLLGKSGITEYAIGDISSAPLPLVSTNGHGRGVYFSNFDLTRPDQFNQTSFTGDSQPGWEVELYRNGELLGFQLVGDNGRYEFKDIPVLYGNNNFKIVSYGPQGQVREDVKNYSIDDTILKRGQFNYRVSADEKSQSLFGIDEQNTPLQTEKEARFVGNIEYGLTDSITAGTGVVTTPLEDRQTHNYQTFSLKNSSFGILSAFDAAYDYKNQGKAAKIAVNTSIKDISTRLEHKEFDNFVSEEELATSNLRKSTNKIDLNGRIGAFIPAGISYGIGAQNEEFANDTNTTTYTNRLATSLFGIGFGNNLQSTQTKIGETKTNLDTGDFSIRGTYKQVFIRLSTEYNIAPLAEMKSVNLSLQKDLSNKLSLRSDIKKDLSATSDLTSINLGLTKELKNYRISAISSADNNSNYTIGIRMSFSAGRNQNTGEWFAKSRDVANSGAISASAFLDDNYNGVYDGEDTMLENTGFQSGSQQYVPEKNSKATLITGVEPYVPIDVEVNAGTLEDPFLSPTTKGYSVKTRPGVITPVVFPVAYTTEIDGTIYQEKNGASKPLPRAIVELVNNDGKVVSSATSEYDGFYILNGVIPGQYEIRLSKETLDKTSLATANKIAISVPPKSDFISGIDITVTSNAINNAYTQPNNTLELGGTVYHQKSNKAKPIASAIVQLLNEKGQIVDTTTSDNSGIYIFTGIKPGNYQLRLGRKTLDKLGVAMSPKIDLAMKNNNEAANIVDITATSDE